MFRGQIASFVKRPHFSQQTGRKHRADPKWLLPLICKAGGLTKRDVGSIKIEDTQTRFEISADAAAAFAQQIARSGSLEKGVTIAPADGVPSQQPPAYKPREPGFKVRSDKGEKLDTGFDFSKGKPKPKQAKAPVTDGQPVKKPRQFARKTGR